MIAVRSLIRWSPETHIIDCDAAPLVPTRWKVEEHRKGGQFEWDPAKVSLHLSEPQKKGGVIEGNLLRGELAEQPVLNANVLEYLLANPHLIPEKWKSEAVFFFGTVYRRLDGILCVACLYWDDSFLRWTKREWFWSYGWLDLAWLDYFPAVVHAN